MLRKLLIVGNPQPFHAGAHFRNAAQTLGLAVEFLDAGEAYAGPGWWRTFNWRLRGHRPSRLNAFSEQAVEMCRRVKPDCLLTTGLAPVTASALRKIGGMGVRRLNFLTDDPWNPAHRAGWFLESLREYDAVFSPRRANLKDLRAHGCREVSRVAFGYAPEIHFPAVAAEVAPEFASDVMFAGGADADRVPYFEALSGAGFKLALYGHDWQKDSRTRSAYRGHADPAALRQAVAGAKICLCLVRRANRDGHAMRSFEVPAMRGCLLVEDTAEHQEIFGEDGRAVVYFNSIPEMVGKAKQLLANAAERERLATAAHDLITRGQNTYADRLKTILRDARRE